MKREKLDKIMDTARQALAPHGFDCLEVEWDQHDELLRLFVDREQGVDMQACVAATKILQDLALIPSKEAGSYQLEVSSPGVERPLRRLEHFTAQLGKQVMVRLTEKVAGRRSDIGYLQAVSPEGEIILETDTGEWVFTLAQLHKAHLVFSWDA